MQHPSFYLSKVLRQLGRSIGANPKTYIAVSVAVGLVLTSGVQQGEVEDDIIKLYFDYGSESKTAWDFIDRNFPVNFSAFLPDRTPTFTPKAEIIFEPLEGRSVLTKEILLEVAYVEHEVRNFTLAALGRNYTWNDVCAKWNGKCYESASTKLTRIIDEVKQPGGSRLDWPIFLSPDDFDVIVLPESLGSPLIDNSSVLTDAGALRSAFYLRDDGELSHLLSRAWQKKFSNLLGTLEKRLLHTKIVYDEDRRVHQVFSELPIQIIKDKLSISIISLIIFSVLAFMRKDMIRSKPLLGIVGVLSTGLAIGASFGLLLVCGVRINALVAAVPFLSLGVGMDDAFVIEAALKKTDHKLTISERMGHAYAEAAVSITITSLTDVLSFLVGLFVPMRAVSEFCAFSALSMGATYLFAIFLFGGFAALSAQWEAEGRHCVTLRILEPVPAGKTPGDTDENKDGTDVGDDRHVTPNGGNGMGFRSFNSSRPLDDEVSDAEGTQPSDLSSKLRRTYVNFLHSWLIRVLLVGAFFAYVGGGVYGVQQMTVDNSWKNLVPWYDAYYKFSESLEKHFLQFPHPVELAIGGDVDYSDKQVQDKIEDMVQGLENSTWFRGSFYTQSWLRGFLTFVEASSDFIKIDISNRNTFEKNLRQFYLEGEGNVNALDVNFDEKGRIKATRFILQPTEMDSANGIVEVMRFLRNEFKNNNTEFEVYHINPIYITLGENSLQTLWYTLSTLVAAAGLMFLITLLLIPNLMSSIYVSVSICTIILGLAGYGKILLGQDLDNAAMVSFIMCVGFSVDYCAHIAFAYTHCKKGRPSEEKLDHALQVVGYPIILGALTTLIGLSGLMTAPSQGLRTFFNIVSSVLVLGVFHGLVVLPVLLITTDELVSWCCPRQRPRRVSSAIPEALEPGIYFVSPPMRDYSAGLAQTNDPAADDLVPMRRLDVIAKLREELQTTRVFLPRIPTHPPSNLPVLGNALKNKGLGSENYDNAYGAFPR